MVAGFFSIRICLIVSLFVFSSITKAGQQQPEPDQTPKAVITTTAPDTVLVGTRVQLDASDSTGPQGEELNHSWQIVHRPLASETRLSIPAPSMPSFVPDKEGLYALRLVTHTNESSSDPAYLLISAVAPAGDAAFEKETFEPSLPCALSAGFVGCSEVVRPFTAVPGSYSLKVTNHGSSSVRIYLNSWNIILPRVLRENSTFVIPVTLKGQNQLKIVLKGEMGSSLDVEIVENTFPADNNSSPQVADASMTVDGNQMGRMDISVSDTDQDQEHTVKLLNTDFDSISLIAGHTFFYFGLAGSSGKEEFDILTHDNGVPVKGVISKMTVNTGKNTPPRLATRRQILTFPTNKRTFDFNVPNAQDAEGDSIHYEVVSSPKDGDLSCFSENDFFNCRYTLPDDSTNGVSFSYRAGDGVSWSESSEIILRPFSSDSTISQLALGENHACAVFNKGNIRCWGDSSYGQLGYPVVYSYERYDTFRDPIPEEDIHVGEEVVKLSLGRDFTCALLKSGTVKCWGRNSYGNLGIPDREEFFSRTKEAFDHDPIDFGTDLKVVDIDSGTHHSCAIFESGQVKCWGRNDEGQLGLGHREPIGDGESPSDVDFVDLGARAVALALGGSHSCALLDQGAVKCWGSNSYGELGLGHTNPIGDDELPSSVPVISLGGRVLQLASGENFSCALLETNTVRCWGRNNNRQLGRGHTSTIGDNEHPSVGAVLDLGFDVVKLLARGSSACAVSDSGQFRCWGDNQYGQLGFGHRNSVSESFPWRPVELAEAVMDMSLGDKYACVLLQSGKMSCWGLNFARRLGLGVGTRVVEETSRVVGVGGISSNLYPRFLAPKEAVVGNSVSFDASNSFVKSGTIKSYNWAFGDGSVASGMDVSHSFSSSGIHRVVLILEDSLGNTASLRKNIRVNPVNFAPFITGEVAMVSGKNKKLALSLKPAQDWEGDNLTYNLVESPSSGIVTGCLGSTDDLDCIFSPDENFIGTVTFKYRANDGTSDSNISTVTINIVEESPMVVDLAMAPFGRHSCALFDNKKIKCWGNNSSGQLGYGHRDVIGDDEQVSDQEFVDVGSGVLQIAVGGSHTCALLEDYSVKCWGSNDSGQLGYAGNVENEVRLPSLIDSIDLGEKIQEIALGADFTCVLGESARVRCWGELEGVESKDPLQIDFIKLAGKAVKISAGGGHACALMEDKSLRCFGANYFGPLGLGHTDTISISASIPRVDVGGDVLDMNLGGAHTCVILADYSVKCWGFNDELQLGYSDDSIVGDDETPSSFPALNFRERAIAVRTSNQSTCALFKNGQVRCWGETGRGLIVLSPPGYNNPATRSLAIPFGGKVEKLALGRNHGCVLLAQGSVHCWGDNGNGRDGDGQLGLGHARDIGDDEFPLAQVASTFKEPGLVVISRFNYKADETNPLNVSFDGSTSFARGTIASYAWDFGDGMTATGVKVSHLFNKAGTHTVQLTVTDTLGNVHQKSQSIIVSPVNFPPLLVLRQNFTFVKNQTSPVQLKEAQDFESTELTYSVDSALSSGTLTGCLEGTDDVDCVFSPAENFTGELSFSYKASDGTNDSKASIVTINIIEEPPVIIEIVSSENHSCALFDNKKIKCWGRNSSGQLGYGHTNDIEHENAPGQEFVDVGGDVFKVVVGGSNTCVWTTDGSVKCWGSNGSDQLGYGHTDTLGDDELPPSIPNLDMGERILDVALGESFTCFLGESGRVKCRGTNYSGQLGLGHTNSVGVGKSFSSTEFIDLGGRAVKVVVGGSHACALMEDKTLRCWGQNSSGQLGLGHYNNIGDNELPSSVASVNVGGDVVDMGLGERHTCTVLADGSAKCWGGYEYTSSPSSTPFMGFQGGAVAIDASDDTNCIVLENKKAQCWFNRYSVRTIDFKERKILDFGVGYGGQCFLLNSGSVRCQQGIRSATIFPEPELNVIAQFTYSKGEENPRLISFDGTDSLAKGMIASYSWNFGDGSSATGSKVSHTFGQAGSHTVELTVTDNLGNTHKKSLKVFIEPENVPPFLASRQKFIIQENKKLSISLQKGVDFGDTDLTYTIDQVPTLGTLSDCLEGTDDLDCTFTPTEYFVGTVTFSYKASNGVSESESSVVTIEVISDHPVPVQIASSGEHACALYRNGKIKCWGRNHVGQLGIGTGDTLGDDELMWMQDFVYTGGKVIQLALGTDHSCAVLEDDTFKCWGGNTHGQLLLGHDDPLPMDQKPLNLSGISLGEPVRQLVAGDRFSCALLKSGGIKCWGKNDLGQLGLGHDRNIGDDTGETGMALVSVNLGSRAERIFAGQSHVCALLREGRIRCWGANESGQLGYGHTDSVGRQDAPFLAGNVPVGGQVVDMALGSKHTCALLNDQSVKCWGHGNYNGRGTTIGDDEWPSTVSSRSFRKDIKEVHAGHEHSCVLTIDDELSCWGLGDDGRLGYGSTGSIYSFYNFNRLPLKGTPVSVVTSAAQNYVLFADGNVQSWGKNDFGQLGQGTTDNVGDDEGISSVDFASLGGSGHPVIARFDHGPSQALMDTSFDASDSYSLLDGSYSWDFGDTMTDVGEQTTHEFLAEGRFKVSLTVSDSLGQTDIASRVVQTDSQNLPPYFFDASETFNIVSGQNTILSLPEAKDSDSSELTYTLVDPPSSGILSSCLGGTLDLNCDYIPGMEETASFTYRANDGANDSFEVFTVFLNITSL